MHRTVRVDIDRLDEYRQRIRDFAAELRRRFHLSRVILFGSFARGDEEVHELSDIDLLIVGDVPGRFEERIGTIRELTDLPIEPLVYTEAEWRRMLDAENFFLEEVEATGVEV